MMMETPLKERFLKDSPSRRLGNLAANLARIEAFGAQSDHRDVVLHLAEESAFFIEWAAPDATPEVQSELVVLQRLLVSWIRSWESLWNSPSRRRAARDKANQWSQRLLQLAGLVP